MGKTEHYGTPDPEIAHGEREWRAWLEGEGERDARAWVEVLQAECERNLAARDPGAVVRLLETALSPSSPVFAALTGPPARELADRLEAEWSRATSDTPHAQEWDARFRDVLEVLRHWVRYRKRVGGPAAGPLPPNGDAAGTQAVSGIPDHAAFEKYYREWVVAPFRENLLASLAARGLSRKVFCQKLRISEGYLSQILSGKRVPTLRKLADISWDLRTDLSRLFATRGGIAEEAAALHGRRRLPEPGDTKDWAPGKVTSPRGALERHYKLVFYPGPDLPGERILAGSFLIVEPEPPEHREGARYVLEDDGRVVVAFFTRRGEGDRMHFTSADGRVLSATQPLGLYRGAVVEAP